MSFHRNMSFRRPVSGYMPLNRRACLGSLAAALALGLAQPSLAQDKFPSKPLSLIVPAAAGGPTDTVARLIAESMGRSLGQTVVVENIGGAGGTVGMARVAAAAPDGYTVAVWHIAQATAPALYDNLKYNVLDGFDSIGRITDAPMSLVAKPGHPAKNLAELMTWIKESGDKVTYGHAGVGSASHLCAMILQKELNVKWTGVPYRGTGPAMNDLIGGQFDIMCDQTTNTTNQIKDGKIKGYAVTIKQAVKSLPDLPTLDATVLKGFEVSAWHAMWAPKGLPKDVSDRLVGALQAALKDPKVIERFASLGAEPVPQAQATPDALKAQLAAEVPRWAAVIKAAGVKGQ
jgi:tripartite-type tricarboxylate transporter receptor subunit TctC